MSDTIQRVSIFQVRTVTDNAKNINTNLRVVPNIRRCLTTPLCSVLLYLLLVSIATPCKLLYRVIYLNFSWHPSECPFWEDSDNSYHKTSCISRTKSQNLNAPRLILQLSLPNPLKHGVRLVKYEDVVGAAPTGDAPTTSEWSTILLHTKVWLILEVLQYMITNFRIPPKHDLIHQGWADEWTLYNPDSRPASPCWLWWPVRWPQWVGNYPGRQACLVHPAVRDKRQVSEIDLSQPRHETAFWWRHNGPVSSQSTDPIKWSNYPFKLIFKCAYTNTHNKESMTQRYRISTNVQLCLIFLYISIWFES